MKKEDFKGLFDRAVASGKGKRVNLSIYLCRDHFRKIGPESVVEGIACHNIYTDYNIYKVTPDSVSFLNYYFGSFDFPCLVSSASYNGTAFKKRTYGENPPILHRKELILPNPPSSWAALTKRLEEKGLFANTNRIGRFKQWKEMLMAADEYELAGRLVLP